MKKKFLTALFLISILTLNACGSSSGTRQPPPPPVEPPAPDRPDPTSFPDTAGLTDAQERDRMSIAGSAEFTGQWSLSDIGADYAYARGYTGDGVTVGIIDTGVDGEHDAFEGKLHSRSAIASDSCPGGTCSFTAIRDTGSHGTAVGGLIAAAKLGDWMHGVAYEAELLAIGIQLGSGSSVYRPVDLSNGPSFRRLDEQRQGIYRRISGATRIINHSFGYEGVVTGYTAAEYRAAFGRTIDSLIQAGTADSEKMILVWSAGNSFGKFDAQGNPADASSPNISAGTPHLFPELKGHFITVVATQSDGTIASYSNRCGVAADFCIAAPGHSVVAPAPRTENRYRRISGTSAAAPHVAGALAVMEEAFRGQLGSTELVTRLFAAADKTGIYANRNIYGEGFLDLEKATRPIGTSRASLTYDLDGPAVALGRTAVAAGPAWGDALTVSLAGREIAVFDSMNAPFFLPMDGFIAPWPMDEGYRADRRFARFRERASDPVTAAAAFPGAWTLSTALDLGSALYERGSGGRWAPRSSAMQNAWLTPGSRGLGVGRDLLRLGRNARIRTGFLIQNAAGTRDEPLFAAGRAHGAFLNLDITGGGVRYIAELGLLHEPERLLGAGAGGAFGGLAGSTWFSRLLAERELAKGLRLVAVAQAGFTSGDAGRGLFRAMQGVLSSAFSAGVYWYGTGFEQRESIWLTVSQPLRNESGGLELDYPIGRTRAGGVLRQSALLGAAPSGRQIDLTLGYETDLPAAVPGARGWRIRLEAWRSYEPGHRARAKPENTLFLAMSRRFTGS